jgi:uncharacterized membrane protein
MNQSTATVLTLVIVFICDFVWLSANKDKYSAMVQQVQPGEPFSINIPAAAVTYVLVALAFVMIVIPKLETMNAQRQSLAEASLAGGLVGLVIYGIYNATNMAIFKNYDTTVAFIDTIWGVVLFAIASGCYVWLRARTKN